MKKNTLLSIVIITGFILLTNKNAFCQTSFVHGNIVNANSYLGIPGLTVYLVHPIIGRSYPSITNEYGYFSFSNVPLRNDYYYVEIYWGNTLIYSNYTLINQFEVNLPTLRL